MAEIKGEKPLILAFNVTEDTSEGQRLRELAREKNIEVKDVLVADFSQKLGAVASLDGYERDAEPYTGDHPTHSIVWFISVDRPDIGWILQEYSTSSGVKSIDLKAILTELNVNWTLEAHYEELQQEHRLMQAYTFLLHARGAFDSMDPADYTEESLAHLDKEITEAEIPVKAMQKGQEVDPDELEALAKRVRTAYQGLVPHI